MPTLDLNSGNAFSLFNYLGIKTTLHDCDVTKTRVGTVFKLSKTKEVTNKHQTCSHSPCILHCFDD